MLPIHLLVAVALVGRALANDVTVASSSELNGDRQLSSTYLSGFYLGDIYSDSNCGGSTDSSPVRTNGYAFNTCMPQGASSAQDSTSAQYWVQYAADMECSTITITTYTWNEGCSAQDSSCCVCAAESTACSPHSVQKSGGLCTANDNPDDDVPSGYSTYTYCDFNSPLPTLAYSNVIQSQYTVTADENGCIGQPTQIQAYPLDTCIVTGTATSQQYSCNANDDGDAASFSSYRTGGCSGTASTVNLNSLCQSAAYSDDTDGTLYSASQNIQYSCQGVSDDDDMLTSGAIAGIVIACLVVFVCIIGTCMLFAMNKKPQLDDEQVALNPMRGSNVNDM